MNAFDHSNICSILQFNSIIISNSLQPNFSRKGKGRELYFTNVDKEFSPKNSSKIMKSYCRYRKLVIQKIDIFFYCLLYSPYRTLYTLFKEKVDSFEGVFFKHTAIKRFHPE